MKKHTALKAILLTTAITLSVQSHATGIPVADGAALAQSAQNQIQTIAQMVKQLTEAQKQLQQMKQQYQAITGNKGFTDILKNGGISDDMLSSFEKLMQGDTADIAQRVQDYFGKNINCPKDVDKGLCAAQYEGVVKQAYAEKLNTELQNRLQRVQQLSQRAQSANDTKAMQELQTNIALEANAIAILKQQADNFERLQEALKEINRKLAYQKYINDKWKGIIESYENGSVSNDSLSDLLN